MSPSFRTYIDKETEKTSQILSAKEKGYKLINIASEESLYEYITEKLSQYYQDVVYKNRSNSSGHRSSRTHGKKKYIFHQTCPMHHLHLHCSEVHYIENNLHTTENTVSQVRPPERAPTEMMNGKLKG